MYMQLKRHCVSKILSFQPYMVGGSFVVDPENANDIDIVVNEFQIPMLVDLEKFDFHPLQSGDSKYDEIDHVRLINVYEGRIGDDKYNIIIVGAMFWPAYVYAINEMKKRPHLYGTRELRIKLHKEACQKIRDNFMKD